MKPRNSYKYVKLLYGKYAKIPEEWSEITIKDATELIIDKRGKTPKKLGIDWTEKGIPVISAMNIENGKLQKEEGIRFINQNAFDKWMPEKLKIGDIILTSEAPLGKALVVTNPNYCIGQRLFALRPNSKRVISEYLYYYLLSNNGKQELIKRSTGSTVKGIRQKELLDVKIILPTLHEQQKIASILSNVDSLINEIKREIEQTQRLKKGLMQKLLTRGIGHTKFKKVKSLFGKYEEIPEEWDFKKLGELTKITDGSHYSPKKVSSGFPFATVANMKDNLIDIDSCYKISKIDFDQLVKNGDQPKIGDVLFTKDGTVGKTLVYNQNEKIVLLSSIAIIRKSEKLDSDYCNYALQSKFMIKHLAKYFGGTAIKRIILQHLSQYQFSIPSLEEQQKIVSILSMIDSKISELESKKTNLEKIKKGLMQKLLTGQIRVQV